MRFQIELTAMRILILVEQNNLQLLKRLLRLLGVVLLSSNPWQKRQAINSQSSKIRIIPKKCSLQMTEVEREPQGKGT